MTRCVNITDPINRTFNCSVFCPSFTGTLYSSSRSATAVTCIWIQLLFSGNKRKNCSKLSKKPGPMLVRRKSGWWTPAFHLPANRSKHKRCVLCSCSILLYSPVTQIFTVYKFVCLFVPHIKSIKWTHNMESTLSMPSSTKLLSTRIFLRLWYFRSYPCVVRDEPDVSEKHNASIFRVAQ